MPTYHVDFVTDRGLERVPFTLDDDRPIGPQVDHVLEELRQRGVILKGGPEDRLAVIWNGREVDPAASPAAAGLSPLYPVELKMRRPAPRAAVRQEPPARPFLPKGSYIGALAGFTGATLAWLLGSLFTDLGDVLVSYGALDLVVAGLLGASVGALVVGLAAVRRSEQAVGAAALGLALGLVGAVLGALVGLFLAGIGGLANTRQGFILARLVVWGLTGGMTGALLGLAWWGRDRRRALDGLFFGLAAGVVGGLVFSLPGPTELWQLVGFGLLGAALGYGLGRSNRALGTIELETVAGRSPGLLRHREWHVTDDATNRFGRRFQVKAARGRLTVVPTGRGGDPASLAGVPLAKPAELVNEDVIEVGEQRFRFRRFPEAAV
ncbi:MAG: hypothetical protein R2909_09310 [Gemmatimonadales bacterium]